MIFRYINSMIIVTGCAGFIGFHVTRRLLEEKEQVIGIDNINDYYDVKIKNSRLNILKKYENFKFSKADISDAKTIEDIFQKEKPKTVIHLAAQAGVKYSLENPHIYVESNIKGFLNILESCKNVKTNHLIYASSSSVYGKNKELPFSEKQKTDSPISLYATTKKCNELMSHAYSHIYQLKTTGLRFFTVYGEWGRPDMSLWIFTENILKGIPIKIYNNGKIKRDFTYIDDIVEAIIKIYKKPKKKLFNVYNIGNSNPVNLMDFIKEIEKELKIKAKKIFLPINSTDVVSTYANVKKLKKDIQFEPKTNFKKGIKKWIKWFKEYKKIS